MASCQGLAGLAVAWEQGSPVYRGSSWGRLSESISSWIAGLPKGYSGVLFIVGEWGVGKSLAASILKQAAESHGFKVRVISPAILKQSRSKSVKSILETLVGGATGPVIAFVDQAEDLVLSGSSAWILLEALGALLDPRDPRGEGFRGRLHLAVALTPASLDRLRAELASRERLGWLLRRVAIIELNPLSKIEIIQLISEAARSVGLSGLNELFSRPEISSSFYWSSAGNPGVALKLLRDLGAGTCPLEALYVLERLSQAIIPSRYGVALTGFDEAALARIKSVGASCGRLEEIALLAAGGFTPVISGAAECAARAGIRVVEAVLFKGLDPLVFVEEAARSACGSSFECRQNAAKAAAELVHPTLEGWAATIPVTGWRGVPRDTLEEAAKAAGGVDSGHALVADLESLERLYPRLTAPPMPFIRDPGVAAAVYAAVSKAIHQGGFDKLVAQGMTRLLKVAGYTSANRLKLKWAGGTYLAPFTVVTITSDASINVNCGETRVVIVVAPEDWKGEAPQDCPNIVIVKAPFGIIRLLGITGYLASSNVPGVDWASLDSQLTSAARELRIPALLDSLASRLGSAGVLVPPNPPVSMLSTSTVHPATMLALLSEALGGVDDLEHVVKRVQGLLAAVPSNCLSKSWAPFEWASKVAPAPPSSEAVAEAARVAVEILKSDGLLLSGELVLDTNAVAKRISQRASIDNFLLPEEARNEALRALHIYAALARVAGQPEEPLRRGFRTIRATDSLEAASRAILGELNLGDVEAGLLAHLVLNNGKVATASTYIVLLEWIKSKTITWNKAIVEALNSLDELLYSLLKNAEAALLNNLRQLKNFRPSKLEAEVEALRTLSKSAKERAKGLADLVEQVYKYYKHEAEALSWPKLKDEVKKRLVEVTDHLQEGKVPSDVLNWMMKADCNVHGGNAIAAILAMVLEEAKKKAASLTRGARRVKAELAKMIALYARLEREGLSRVLSNLKPPSIDVTGDQRGILQAVEAMRIELESLASNSRLLARLEEEAEKKVSIIENLFTTIIVKAKNLESRSLTLLEQLRATKESLPPSLMERIENLSKTAEEAVQASSEAVELAERLRSNAKDLIDLMTSARSSAAVDAAERAVIRLGGIIDELNSLINRISGLTSTLLNAKKDLLQAVEAEASTIIEKIKVIQESFESPPTETVSQAEISARAATSHAREGRLNQALTALADAVRMLDEAIASGALGVTKLELLVYMTIRKRGKLQINELASEAKKFGISKEEVIKAVMKLHERGLVRLEVHPSI